LAATLERTLTDQISFQLSEPIEEEVQEENEPIDLLEWTSKYRRFLVPERRFDLDRHRYLEKIYKDTSRQIVIYKAAQMGASELGISKSLYNCDNRNATGIYGFPTETHVSKFSAARFGPAIEASDYLSSIIGDKTEGKRAADRVSLKRVRNRFLYFVGAQVKPDGRAPQLKSIDGDFVVLDEIDEWDQRAIPIIEKRVGHSKIKEFLYLSTPTYSNVGIHAKWLETDQKIWFIPCGHCGKKQLLSIDKSVTEYDALGRPVNWHGYPDKAFMVCEKCGGALDRLVDGEWVQTFPDREISGYHLTKLFSAQTSLLSIIRSLQTIDETEKKEAINQNLGEPYVPKGGRLTDEILDKNISNFPMGAKKNEQTVMGVDVGSVLNVVIRGITSSSIYPLRYAGITDSFSQLNNLMREYNVKVCVIDALPETRKAREFQADQERGKVWLCYYAGSDDGTKYEDDAVWNKKERIVNVDRTRSLDRTFTRFYDIENHLPENIKGVYDYYKQMKAPVRVLVEKKDGKKVAKYIESGQDHYAHAENYCTIASEGKHLSGWARGMSG